MIMTSWTHSLFCYFVFLPKKYVESAFEAERSKLTCSFETDFCQWNNPSSTWRRSKYSYEISFTGPQEDGGQSGSHYIYVSESTIANDIAHLQSPFVDFNQNSNGRNCFRFWYYMYGEHIRNLTIEKGSEVVFHRYGDQLQGWKCGIFDITRFSGQITFNVYRNTAPYSVIAIDNIEVIESIECRQDKCGDPDPIPAVTAVTETTTTSTSTSSKTSVDFIRDGQEQPTVIETLPVAIGVPFGVLIVGAVVVGVCIYKRKQSKELLTDSRLSQDSNVYTRSPRQSGYGHEHEEVYDELNEDEMIEMNHIRGDNDQQQYDEIDGVKREKAEYVNEQSGYYFELGKEQIIPNGSIEPTSDDYMEPGNKTDVLNEPTKSQSNSGLQPIADETLDSENYLRPKHYMNLRSDSENYLKPGTSIIPGSNDENNSESEAPYQSLESRKKGRPDSHDYLETGDLSLPKPTVSIDANNFDSEAGYQSLKSRNKERPDSHDYLETDDLSFLKPLNEDDKGANSDIKDYPDPPKK